MSLEAFWLYIKDALDFTGLLNRNVEEFLKSACDGFSENFLGTYESLEEYTQYVHESVYPIDSDCIVFDGKEIDWESTSEKYFENIDAYALCSEKTSQVHVINAY